MSNSVVRVRETPSDGSIFLIIGENGMITPDKETVQEYLKSRGETEIKIMQVNKSDGKTVDVTFDHMTYVAAQKEEVMYAKTKEELEQIAKSLFNFRLDHDYTPFIHSPPPPDLPDIDEIDRTLGLLEGTSELDPPPPELIPIIIDPPHKLVPNITAPPLTLIAPHPIVKDTKPLPVVTPTQNISKVVQKPPVKTKPPKPVASAKLESSKPIELTKIIEAPKPVFQKNVSALKPISSPKHVIPPKPIAPIVPAKEVIEDEIEEEAVDDDDEEEEQYSDDDFTMESADDANDSDFEIDEMPKTRSRTPRKSITKIQPEVLKVVKSRNVTITKQKVIVPVTPKVKEPIPPPPPLEIPVEKQPDKKLLPKKEKKPPKPIPNDFMLFATPDIIRRVGGKQDATTPTTPNTPPVSVEIPPPLKPTNTIHVTPSNPERLSTETKEKHLSIDKPPHRLSTETKKKDRRRSAELIRQGSTEQKNIEKLDKIDRRASSDKKRSSSKGLNEAPSQHKLEGMPSAKDIRAIIQNENTKSYTSDMVIPDVSNPSTILNKSEEDEELSIDNMEEILYKVAETLAGDKEFQSALDKSLDENLVLNSAVQNTLSTSFNHIPVSQESHLNANLSLRGTQIIRPDGRVVVIPPPERPTTRSRNKGNPAPLPPPPPLTTTPSEETIRVATKVLEEELVSGAELDSSSDEDRSDDDPDKLWCICNQPHNNRFMICCDLCEEWYHGKCVNVTKQMGQMMEKEGKEWICLYCKDKSLKRPAAAARRVRKASRTSTSGSVDHSDSNMDNLIMSPINTPQKVQGCLVCGKPCRNHSIFCSDACIVQNAKDVEKVVVFDRANGTFLSGNAAPTAANLDKWLKKHPSFEVVRSKADVQKAVVPPPPKINTVKPPQSKDPVHHGVSALEKRGVHVGYFSKEQPHPKEQQAPPKAISKISTETKMIIKKPSQTKLIQPLQMVLNPAPISHVHKKRKSVHKPAVVETPSPKEKLKPKLPKPKPVSEPPLSPEKKQENIRDNVKKSLCEQLLHRIKPQEEIKLNKDEVAKISGEIESQLFKCFGDTGQKYRNKYRSLMFNIKDGKNQTLWRGICQKRINPYQLVRLSPDDLASQELALWRERENKHQLDMITKNELDQLGRPQQFVIKTHKGEQEVEDNRLSSGIDKTEMVTGLTTTEGVTSETTALDKKAKNKDKKKSRSERNKKYAKKSSRDKDKSDRKDYKKDKHSLSREKNQKRRSRSRSRGSTRHSEKHRSTSRDKHRRSHKTSRHKKSPLHSSSTEKLDKKSKEILENLVDNKIVPPLEDKLWKHVTQEDITTAPIAESDSDHEPTSTVTIPTPPHASDHEDLTASLSAISVINEREVQENSASMYLDDEGGSSPPPKTCDIVWAGTINMVDVAEITITAHEVSGDCSGLGDELPTCLDVVGRISPDTVWDYISKMKSSNSKGIALLRLNSTSVEAQMPYIALYSYLQSRNRLGVVKSYNKAVKDFYILPLASHMPIPQALLPLSGPSFEECRPVLLLGIIVRDKRKRPLFASSTPVAPKRFKIDKPSTPPIIVPASVRSYTPPPTIEPRFKSTPPPKPIVTSSPKETEEDMDEPYSPKDSDPDTLPTNGEDDTKSSVHLSSSDLSNILSGPVKSSTFLESSFVEPFTNKFESIPGLVTNPVLFENQQLQREMEVLDQQIAKQKAEIQNMSQNIASTSTTRVGVGRTLSAIELPSNIQQILDSIKTPQSTSKVTNQLSTSTSSDLTIPLLLPKISARNSSSSSSPTIPLNLPRFKNKPTSSNSPSMVEIKQDSYSKRTTERSVLSSFSDDELIRKANEMMNTVEEAIGPVRSQPTGNPPLPGKVKLHPGNVPMCNVQPPLPMSTTSNRLESSQPPIPGLD